MRQQHFYARLVEFAFQEGIDIRGGRCLKVGSDAEVEQHVKG